MALVKLPMCCLLFQAQLSLLSKQQVIFATSQAEKFVSVFDMLFYSDVPILWYLALEVAFVRFPNSRWMVLCSFG
jgi:hypothetical protein